MNSIPPVLIGVVLFLLTTTVDSFWPWRQPAPGSNSISSSSSLDDVAKYLRADDTRLVRHNVTELTAERQNTEACTTHLEKAYQVLLENHVDDKSRSFVFDNDASISDVVVDALNVISLCSLGNPEHRSKFSSSQYTLLKSGALTALITVNINPARTSAAAECMFALAQNSLSNQEALIKAGAIEALSSLFNYWDCDSTGAAVRAQCWLSTMWSVAALSRLSDAYCVNDPQDGDCSWTWRSAYDEDEDDEEIMEEDGRHIIDTDHDLRYDAKPVRLQLMRDLHLMHSLEEYICDQANFEMHKSPSERAWPTRIQLAEAGSAIIDAPIVVWAVLSLLKTLSLSPGLYERLSDNLLGCLCKNALHNPDWMERMSATEILYRLGFDKDENCGVEQPTAEDEMVDAVEVPSENAAPAIPSEDDDETDDGGDDDETDDDEQEGQHEEL